MKYEIVIGNEVLKFPDWLSTEQYLAFLAAHYPSEYQKSFTREAR